MCLQKCDFYSRICKFVSILSSCAFYFRSRFDFFCKKTVVKMIENDILIQILRLLCKCPSSPSAKIPQINRYTKNHQHPRMKHFDSLNLFELKMDQQPPFNSRTPPSISISWKLARVKIGGSNLCGVDFCLLVARLDYRLIQIEYISISV